MEHDAERRRRLADVTGPALDHDGELWIQLGRAIGQLAAQIRTACRASVLGAARPELAALVSRLSEAIDDQVDPPAWRVIDAAARLDATKIR